MVAERIYSEIDQVEGLSTLLT